MLHYHIKKSTVEYFHTGWNIKYGWGYYSKKISQFLLMKKKKTIKNVNELNIQLILLGYHHHVVLLARISLTLTHHFSQSFIASDRSSGLHLESSHSCCMYVRAGRPAFARPYAGVHRSTSLMSSSLLLQQCPASSNNFFSENLKAEERSG